jgi:hypothetical protein
MMTVNEVSKLTGVSIRTLQYYDKIGLLHPAEYTEAGYRLYDDAALVKKLQDYITQNFYTCTNEILSGLGKMYAGGGDFTKNIDSCGGEGTAEFAHQAIEIYCK